MRHGFLSGVTLQRLYVGILLVIFGGIVLHAPISVGLGSLFPDYELAIKSWKEILMGMATVLAGVLLYRNKQVKILKEPLMVAIGIYALLHLVSVVIFARSFVSSTAGLLIDLRYLLFFVLVYVAVRLYPKIRRQLLITGLVGAAIVAVFGFLQATILPHNILEYIGYNRTTIIPYLLIDQNSDFVRINSTLRGPNPLGAYMAIVLSVLLSWCLSKKQLLSKKYTTLILAFSVCCLVTIWVSYSRSAILAATLAGFLILLVRFRHVIAGHLRLVVPITVVLLMVSWLVLSNNTFVSNVFLHENPDSNSQSLSNEKHVESLVESYQTILGSPLGSGVGSTGSATQLDGKLLVVENQYLYIAHEVGWLGLGLFIFIFVVVMSRLWALRHSWLGLGLFASGLGMAIIGLVLPVWADDTVAIIWWGAAGLAISYWSIEKRGASHGKQVD